MIDADPLIDLAFREGLQAALGDPRIQAKFPIFRPCGTGATSLESFFIPRMPSPPPCPSDGRLLHSVCEAPDRKGLTFGWSAAFPGKLDNVFVPWIDLEHMPAPSDTHPNEVAFAQHRANGLWEIVTGTFVDKIKRGEVELQGCIGSPLVKAKALEPQSLRYMRQLNWKDEIAVIGDDLIYNLRPLNLAQGTAPRPILPKDRALTLLKTHYPLGVPAELSHAELTRRLNAFQGNPKNSQALLVDVVTRAREAWRRRLQAQSRA